MYGLLQGLQSGTRDAQAANELAMRERQMAEERAMRQRQLAMQEAQHAAAMESMGLQLKQQRGIDTAMEGLRGLQKREQDNQAFIASGLAGPVMPVTEQDQNNAYMGLAHAKGDIESASKLQMRNKLLEANEEAQRLAQDMPAARKLILPFFDKSAIPVTIVPGTTDPKTGKQKTPDRIKFEDGYEHKVSDADVVRMLQGAMYSKRGLNDEADKAFESVNKRLRDAVNEGNKRKLEGYKFEETSRHNIANEELRGEQLGLIRDQRRAVGASRSREVPPEILKELSNLEQMYIQAEPKARPEIERQYQMVLSRAGAAVGKPMGLPNARPPAPEPKVNPDGSVVKDGVLYLPNPKKPGEFAPAKGLGPSALDKALEAYGAGGTSAGAAPAQPAQVPARPVRPPGASADYGVYGTPGYDQYLQDMMLQRFAQDRAPATGLLMPMRPVDFTKYNSAR